jgi:membrane protease YdiL (CAAX protease family)
MQDLIETLNPEHLSLSMIVLGVLFTALISAGILLDIILLIRLRRNPLSSSDLALRLQATPWTLTDVGVIVLMVVALLSLFMIDATLSGYFGLDSADGDKAPLAIVSQTILFHVTVFVTILSLMRMKCVSWKETFGLQRHGLGRNIVTGIVLYVAAMPVVIFFSLLYTLLLQQLGFAVEPQDVIIVLSSPDQPGWLQVCLVSIALTTAPFLEELFFRGVAMPVASRYLRPLTAIYLVSFAFAMIHAHIPSLVPLFIIAVAFSLAYLYTGSIIVPVVMHVMFNGVTLAVLFLLKLNPDIACEVKMFF